MIGIDDIRRRPSPNFKCHRYFRAILHGYRQPRFLLCRWLPKQVATCPFQFQANRVPGLRLRGSLERVAQSALPVPTRIDEPAAESEENP
jgi:hypothetical protein